MTRAPEDGARDRRDALARGLGWLGLALGTAQLAAPARVARLVGVEDGPGARVLMRAVGAQELASGVAILTRPRPASWLWARAAGDAVHLALLGVAAATAARSRPRLALAAGAVAGALAADALEGMRLGRVASRASGGVVRLRQAITVNRDAEALEAAWRDAGGLEGLLGADDGSASVRLSPAPGGRGTELVVEVARAGELRTAARKLLGRDVETRLADELRRFKQVVEVGEVVRSEGSPAGHALRQHLRREPAQPRGGAR